MYGRDIGFISVERHAHQRCWLVPHMRKARRWLTGGRRHVEGAWDLPTHSRPRGLPLERHVLALAQRVRRLRLLLERQRQQSHALHVATPDR